VIEEFAGAVVARVVILTCPPTIKGPLATNYFPKAHSRTTLRLRTGKHPLQDRAEVAHRVGLGDET
jgi:hypothetical protein